MERRYFTNGARIEPALTPASVVQFQHDGWRECDAPEPSAEDETPENQTGEDELPNGTTDDQ